MRKINYAISEVALNLIQQYAHDLDSEKIVRLLRRNDFEVSRHVVDEYRLFYIDLRNKNREKRIKLQQKAIEDPILYRAKSLIASAKKRSDEQGLAFNLTVEWLCAKLKQGHCEVTNIPFRIKSYTSKEDVNYTSVHNFAPSIDRINPNKGYTIDNVQIVIAAFNYLKSDKTNESELYTICKAVCEKYEETGKINRK
jgi:hypothetical protein